MPEPEDGTPVRVPLERQGSGLSGPLRDAQAAAPAEHALNVRTNAFVVEPNGCVHPARALIDRFVAIERADVGGIDSPIAPLIDPNDAPRNAKGHPYSLIQPDPIVTANAGRYRTADGLPLAPLFEVVERCPDLDASLAAETAWIVRFTKEGHRLRNIGAHKRITRRKGNAARWWADTCL